MTQIQVVPSLEGLREFFHDLLLAVVEDQRIAAAPPTTGYLADLLCEYVTYPADEPTDSWVAVAVGGGQLELPVAELKRIGDHALYVAGYQTTSARPALLDVAYYDRLGSSAYLRLSRLLRASDITEVYRQLAEDFRQFVSVLGEVRRHTGTSSGDLVALCQRYLDSGSALVRRQLATRGVFVGDRGAKNN